MERRPDSRGKVRDIYDAGENLLMVATDRISAFDFILPDEIPFKGEVLNRISAFWFDKFADIVPNHLVSIDPTDFPEEFAEYRDYLVGRAMLGKKPEELKLISCHLGNGSSIAAVDQGKVVDTSMGMTPLAGLMMGTRCGDLDPSVVNYLKYTLNITGHELDEILNKKSGLLGISGVSSDKRDVEEAALHGNKRAQLASDMLNYQIKKVVGSYIAAMGGVDAIVFTGGIGEHDEIARAKVCHHMDWLGIRIDTEKNEHPVGDVCDITAWGAKVRTLVIATDEELMIARDTKEVLEK